MFEGVSSAFSCSCTHRLLLGPSLGSSHGVANAFAFDSVMAAMAQYPQMGRVLIGNGDAITWEHHEDISLMSLDNSSSLSLSSGHLPGSVGGHDVDIDSNASGDESRAYHVEDVVTLTSTNIALFKYPDLSLDAADTANSQAPFACSPGRAGDVSNDPGANLTEPDSASGFHTPTCSCFRRSSSAGSTPTIRNTSASPGVPTIDDSNIDECIPALRLSMAGEVIEEVLEEGEEESSGGSMTEVSRVDGVDDFSSHRQTTLSEQGGPNPPAEGTVYGESVAS